MWWDNEGTGWDDNLCVFVVVVVRRVSSRADIAIVGARVVIGMLCGTEDIMSAKDLIAGGGGDKGMMTVAPLIRLGSGSDSAMKILLLLGTTI